MNLSNLTDVAKKEVDVDSEQMIQDSIDRAEIDPNNDLMIDLCVLCGEIKITSSTAKAGKDRVVTTRLVDTDVCDVRRV
jgi:hypothetical protein